MKKSFGKILFSLSCVTLLASCGTKDMNTLKDEDALNLTTDILKRQNDPSLFTLPDQFSYTSNTSSSSSYLLPDEGKGEDKNEITIFNQFNLNTLAFRINYKYVTSTLTVEKDVIEFYDSEKKILYYTVDDNGYKYRTEETYEIEDAKTYFKERRDTYFTYAITMSDYLANFQYILQYYQAEHEKYKSETDQYFNYYLGSNDAKSFQVKTNRKEKTDEITPEFEIELSGYYAVNNNFRMENDMLKTSSYDSNYEVKSSDNKFYNKSTRNTSSTYTYGNISITIPDITQYEKK